MSLNLKTGNEENPKNVSHHQQSPLWPRGSSTGCSRRGDGARIPPSRRSRFPKVGFRNKKPANGEGGRKPNQPTRPTQLNPTNPPSEPANLHQPTNQPTQRTQPSNQPSNQLNNQLNSRTSPTNPTPNTNQRETDSLGRRARRGRTLCHGDTPKKKRKSSKK